MQRQATENILPYYIKMRSISFSWLVSAMIVLLLLTGCSLSNTPSDAEVVSLVKDYYLYFHAGTQVDASIIERGQLLEECNCYPVKFKICYPENKTCDKTLYLFKNQSGKVEISEFMPKNAA